jgi:cytochrome P450
MTSTVPHFPLSDPEFDTTSEVVHRTRDERWWVETDYGWAVLTYEKSAALLRDRRFRQGNAKWPEQNGIHSGRFSGWWKEVLLSLEGDDHARIRRLLMPAFRNKVIAAMRPQFQALAGELIDGFASRGEVEFISEFAEPYSARILCQLLGLPEDNWHQVAKWADDLGKSFGIAVKDDLPRIEAALDGLYGYVDEVVGQRMAEPADDLVTTLVQASTEEDGRLSRHELGVALVFLAFAGMETTRNQLGLALQTLLAHPDQWRLLAEQPDLGSNAVEEVMRVNPTVTWITREALEEVDLGDGLVVPAGGIVQTLSHSAGTDPAAMPDPAFDIRELRPPHLGFGAGVHHCLGHFVARTDMAVALPLLARRMPDARPAGPGRWLPVSGNTGALEFPIRFTPGS